MLTALSTPAPLLQLKETHVPFTFGQCLAGVVAWCGLLVGAVLALNAVFPASWHLTQSAFSNWDAEHYLYIRLHGYDEMRTAFFPLFPYLWRWLNVSPVAMGLLNLALFAVSFAALAWQFQWPWRTQLVLLSVPSLMFMALPFSEAVFFASGTALLLGLRRQLPWLYCLGLLLSCTCRAAAFVILPAVAATFLLAHPPRLRHVGTALTATAATLLGLGISMLVHKSYTGQWLSVFKAQRFWDNHLQWPTLPLRNWAGSFPTRFEAPPFLIGLGCAVGLVWLAWRHWRQPLPTVAQPIIFALAYLGGVTFITVATRGGVLVSLSRYIYATPYFLLLLAEFKGRVRLSSRQLVILFLLMEAAWLALFGAYMHIRSVLGYTAVSAVVMLWLLNAHQQPLVRRWASLPTMLVGTGLLLYLLMRFLAHEWVA
ncbi:hypothetical protein [Hymenobacter sp. B1770]|uniref:hypothetical protein n=1 Tax=Hymenobacter sp. B1770 TaxID=1718788 RepID=UPI003CF08878